MKIFLTLQGSGGEGDKRGEGEDTGEEEVIGSNHFWGGTSQERELDEAGAGQQTQHDSPGSLWQTPRGEPTVNCFPSHGREE